MKKSGGPSYQTGPRGGVFREVNGKRLYGRLKGRTFVPNKQPSVKPAQAASPKLAQTPAAKPSNKTIYGEPLRAALLPGSAPAGSQKKAAKTVHDPSLQKAPARKSRGSKDFLDHATSLAKQFIPDGTPERIQLATRALSMAKNAVSSVSDIEQKHPGVLNSVKRWAAKKAINMALSSVGRHAGAFRRPY